MPVWNVRNHLVELAEISIDSQLIDSALEEETEIRIDLRFTVGEIEIQGQEVLVGFQAAELYLVMDGVEITPGSRYGDHKIEASLETTASISSRITSSSGHSMHAAISAGPVPSAKLNSQNETLHRLEDTIGTQARSIEYRVTARPNGMWLLEGPDGGPLKNTYFNGDLLCKVRPINGANRQGAKIHLFAKKKHVWFKAEGRNGILSRLGGGNVNLDKVFKALLAKSIGNYNTNSPTLIEISSISNYDD